MQSKAPLSYKASPPNSKKPLTTATDVSSDASLGETRLRVWSLIVDAKMQQRKQAIEVPQEHVTGEYLVHKPIHSIHHSMANTCHLP